METIYRYCKTVIDSINIESPVQVKFLYLLGDFNADDEVIGSCDVIGWKRTLSLQECEIPLGFTIGSDLLNREAFTERMVKNFLGEEETLNEYGVRELLAYLNIEGWKQEVRYRVKDMPKAFRPDSVRRFALTDSRGCQVKYSPVVLHPAMRFESVSEILGKEFGRKICDILNERCDSDGDYSYRNSGGAATGILLFYEYHKSRIYLMKMRVQVCRGEEQYYENLYVAYNPASKELFVNPKCLIKHFDELVTEWLMADVLRYLIDIGHISREIYYNSLGDHYLKALEQDVGEFLAMNKLLECADFACDYDWSGFVPETLIDENKSLRDVVQMYLDKTDISLIEWNDKPISEPESVEDYEIRKSISLAEKGFVHSKYLSW